MAGPAEHAAVIRRAAEHADYVVPVAAVGASE